MPLHVLCLLIMRWLGGDSEVSPILAICTVGLQSPCVSTHTLVQVTYLAAATLVSIYTTFSIFLVF